MLVHLVPGGWSAILADARASGKLQFVSWSWDLSVPFTFWAGLIGGCFLTMASHGTDQLLVQRLLTCRNQRESQKALILSGFVVFAQFALFLTIGMMLHAYYATHPLPAMASNDEIFPAFIVRSLPHGIAGLVIAAIFAAAMSNLSGSLNSLASSSVLDFYQPLAGRDVGEQQMLRLSRWLTAAWGLVLIAIAILARGWGSVFTVGLTIASIVYGPMLGAFLMGTLTKSATQRGVMAGIAVSLVSMIGIRVFTPLAWTWYVLAGAAICVAVGLAVSRVSR
jgi:SSS family solute:Na+ symporter